MIGLLNVKNLHNSWLFNIIPGTLTIVCAFALRIDIIVALLLSQSGLGLGVANAMLPLRQISEKEKLQLQNRRDAQQLPKNSKNPSTSIPTKEIIL